MADGRAISDFRRSFFERVDEDGPLPDEGADEEYPSTRCHLWTGPRRTEGYGKVYLKGTAHPAHRVAYVLAGGKLEGELTLVVQLCGRRDCVNPEHLVVRSRSQISRIRDGESLDEVDVLEMVTLRTANPRRWTFAKLGERYGCSKFTVRSIFRGRTWSWLTGIGIDEDDDG